MSSLVLPLTLLLLGAPAPGGKGAPPQGQTLILPPFGAAQPLGPLGVELSRAVAAELARLRIETQREGGKDTRGEARVEGQVSTAGEVGLVLRLSYRGATVEVQGDMEHLTELAQSAALKIQALVRGEPPPAPGKPPSPPGKDKDKDKDKDRDRPPLRPPTPGPKKDPERPSLPLPPPPDMAPPPVVDPPRPTNPIPPAPPVVDPPRPTNPVPPPVNPVDVQKDREKEELRVAVHVMGEPQMAIGQGAFYGVGLQGQQALLTFLRRRLHVQAVSSPLNGLVRGEDARDMSLRYGAPFTLMARFDALHISSSGPGYGPLTLTGRVHLVLLYKGTAVFDRRATLPTTPVSQSEAPGTLVARALTTVLEGMSDDLSHKLRTARGP